MSVDYQVASRQYRSNSVQFINIHQLRLVYIYGSSVYKYQEPSAVGMKRTPFLIVMNNFAWCMVGYVNNNHRFQYSRVYTSSQSSTVLSSTESISL